MPEEDVKVLADLWMDDLEMARAAFESRAKRCGCRLKSLGLRVPDWGGVMV